jgi:hypothetical protein
MAPPVSRGQNASSDRTGHDHYDRRTGISNSPDVLMRKLKVFVSHSSKDKPFASILVDVLKRREYAPWIDSEQIVVGENLLREVGNGLSTMDVLLAIVSQSSLSSGWVEEELSYAMLRVIADREVLLLPFRIDSTAITELPWYLQARLAPQVSADETGARAVAAEANRAVQRRDRASSAAAGHVRQDRVLLGVPEIAMAKEIEPGDWSSATLLAVKIILQTDRNGRNPTFEALVSAVLAGPAEPEDNGPVIGMCATIEKCVELLPRLAARELLWNLGTHEDFSVRTSAASICLDLSQFAPSHVPVDLLFRLASPDEDWYVDAPATAALLSLARHQRAVIGFFYLQLHDTDPYARAHGAEAIARVAKMEPEILNADDLELALGELERVGHSDTASAVRRVLGTVKKVHKTNRSAFRYGL